MSRKKRLQKKAEKGKKSEAKQQAMAAKAAAKPKKKRVKLNVVEGRGYIKSTFNNTLITITEGRVIATGSAGQQGFRGSKKSTSFAASKAASAAIGKALTTGLQRLQIFVQGVGTGREAAIRAIAHAGVDVTSIKDMT